MVSEHKKIVLRQLDGLDAFKFRMIKALLDKELKLTDKMQEDYDIIKIANMLEEKFPKDAGVKKLIEVCKNMPSLENLADKLKEEKEKVRNKNKRKSNGAQRKRKQDEPNTPQPVLAGSEASKTAPSAKKKKKKTIETQGSKKQKLTKIEDELLKPSVTNTQKGEDCLYIPPLTPSTKSSNSAIKKRRNKTIKNKDSKKMKFTQEQDQFPEPIESNKLKTEDCPQTPHKPSPTSSSNSSTKKKRNNTEDSKKMKLTQEQNQLPESSVTNTLEKEFCSQTPHKPFPISFGNFLTEVPQVPPSALSMGIQAPQVPQVIASSGLPISHMSQSTAPSDILAPQVFPKPVSTHLLASQVFPGTTSSNLVPSMPIKTILKEPKREEMPTEPSKEALFQEGPKQVMVLNATKPFTYDMRKENQMFHATVATETELFRVKVFDIVLRTKFDPNKVIAISRYVVRNGFLEIYSHDCVSEMTYNQMNISTTLRRRASATPKIVQLFSKQSGVCVNGLFQVEKKNVRNEIIYYTIQDKTGTMEVVVFGRLTNINCEPGDRLRLFCFELALSASEKWQLKTVRHSYMEVVKGKKQMTTNQP